MKADLQIKKLPQRFEQKGDCFQQVYEDERNYIYKHTQAGADYFEVFKKKLNRCFDFDTKLPTGELKESYPKDKDFGKTAWCCRSFESAMEYVEKLTQIMPKVA